MKVSSLKSVVFSSLLAQPFFLACGTEDPAAPAPTGTNMPVTPAIPGQCLTQTGADGNLLLMASEVNNYTLANQLMVKSTPIAPGADLTLDWSALTMDMFRHPIAAGELDRVSIAQWSLTHAGVLASLATDELGTGGALVLGIEHVILATETTIPITQMQIPFGGGQPPADQIAQFLDPAAWPPSTYSYTVTINTGEYLTSGARMIHHAYVDPASTNGVIALTNDSTVVSVQVQIASKPAISIPAGSSAITVDWSQMTMNALQQPFVKNTVAEVRVMHFPLTPTEMEVEQNFLDLETITDASYVGTLESGDKLSLATLTDGAGAPFPGIDPARGGTWVVALFCFDGLCGNPAPWFMARLEACPAVAAL